MKKICRLFSVMLIVAMVLGGCGKANTPDTEANTRQTESQGKTENVTTSEVETEESTEAVSETTTEVSTETESEATNQAEKETPEESEAPSEEPQAPTYTYVDLYKTMYAKSSVNVRDLPSTDGNKLGGLSKAQEVHVTGQCNETNWYRIEYNGGIGYVSGSYLVNEKPEVETQPREPSSNWYDGYEMYVWYDMGEYFFMRVASVDEAIIYQNQLPAESWQLLRDCYPDREIIMGGTGPNCAVISALYTDQETGFPIWSIDYVWD